MTDSVPKPSDGDPATRLAELMRQLQGVKVPPGLQQYLDRQKQLVDPRSSGLAASLAATVKSTAAEFHRGLQAYIERFEAELDQMHEVGVRLVNFGSEVRFRLESIGYSNPSLISFRGKMEDGSPVELVQHVSQISVLLVRAKRVDTSAPRKPIGFA